MARSEVVFLVGEGLLPQKDSNMSSVFNFSWKSVRTFHGGVGGGVSRRGKAWTASEGQQHVQRVHRRERPLRMVGRNFRSRFFCRGRAWTASERQQYAQRVHPIEGIVEDLSWRSWWRYFLQEKGLLPQKDSNMSSVFTVGNDSCELCVPSFVVSPLVKVTSTTTFGRSSTSGPGSPMLGLSQ